MSKYEELAKHAANYSRAGFVSRDAARVAAFRLVQGYAEHIQAPTEKFSFVKLDGRLQRTTVNTPFTREVPVILDVNAFWYFCFTLKFELPSDVAYVNQMLTLGVRPEGELITVREERDFEIRFNDTASTQRFYEYLVSETLREFDEPLRMQHGRIGFVLPER